MPAPQHHVIAEGKAVGSAWGVAFYVLDAAFRPLDCEHLDPCASKAFVPKPSELKGPKTLRL